MKNIDVHSFARPHEAVIKHLNLELKVDFEQKKLSGRASFDIENLANADKIILDTRGLVIEKVTLDKSEESAKFELGDEQPFLGSPLTVNILPDTRKIHIHYSTGSQADAVQWLDPVQTAGGKHPFMFTQSQAILARTWVPVQDSPGIRFTYDATVQVPADLLALMSATNPVEKNATGKYSFRMTQPIPAYLLALSAGNLEFRSIDTHTGVYAEPESIEKAANEFADMERMLRAAEELYGEYQWERYDVLVLPPSFPFGGMENPRLTFATPTILSGDRSLVSLIAHELAHSWSGNLVTNATWNDFWLNEGFTVYFERRIMESLEGKDYADMLEVLGHQDLQREVRDQGPENPGTKLKLNLKDKDPDDGMNQIAYEKGYFLLRKIEDRVGRSKFDQFLKTYFSEFKFRSMDTESFIEYISSGLLQGETEFLEEVKNWIYNPGIPSDIKVVTSTRFNEVDRALSEYKSGTAPGSLTTKGWSTHEWLHFLRKLPPNVDIEKMKVLDEAFNFTNSGNAEILAAWFDHVIRHNYEHAFPALRKFLTSVGRRKFVLPLYKALAKTGHGKQFAKDIYKQARPNYHAVTISSVDELLGKP